MAKTPIFLLSTARARAGYTLAELLVVLTILGLVTAIAAPRFTTRSDPALLRQSTTKTVNLLRSAKIISRRTGTSIKVFINPLQKQIWIEGQGETLQLDPKLNLIVTGAEVESVDETIGIRFFPGGMSTGGEINLAIGSITRKIEVIWANGEVRLAQD